MVYPSLMKKLLLSIIALAVSESPLLAEIGFLEPKAINQNGIYYHSDIISLEEGEKFEVLMAEGRSSEDYALYVFNYDSAPSRERISASAEGYLGFRTTESLKGETLYGPLKLFNVSTANPRTTTNREFRPVVQYRISAVETLTLMVLASGIEDNSTSIATNETAIVGNVRNITANETGVAANVISIAGNTTSIGDNVTGIATNENAIAGNTTGIAGNTSSIQDNATGVAANVISIAGNLSKIQLINQNIEGINRDLDLGENERGKNALEIGQNQLRFQALENQIDSLGSDAAFIEELGEEFATKDDLTTVISEGKTQGINAVTSDPNNWNIFTTDQIQEMAVGDLVLTREENGDFVLNYEIQQSDNAKDWTTYSAQAETITGLPVNKAFVRIRTR